MERVPSEGRRPRLRSGAVAVAAAVSLPVLALTACGGDDGAGPAAAASPTSTRAVAPFDPSDIRDVVLRTSDGLKLEATYYDVGDPTEVVTVLVAHGNGGSRGMRRPIADALAARGMAVLLLDYRGYGGNPGRPSEPGLAKDADAAYKFLLAQGVAPERLLYFGESLGTAVVADLARRHPPAAVLLRSPFTTYAAIGAEAYYPADEVPVAKGDVFATVDYIADVQVPVTVVWGDFDMLVPPAQSREVADSAPNLAEVVVVPGVDHNDQELLDGRLLIEAVVRLADRVAG